MELTIITINRNNADGLDRTMKSVLSQTRKDFEYIVIDGYSSDRSIDVIHRYASQFGNRLMWVSEPDNGIYNAMNKGILMASGDYIQILNSGDCLNSEGVIEKMLVEVEKTNRPTIFYGNMIKCFPDGKKIVDKSFAGQEITLLGMYSGTVNHSPVFFCRSLFNKYGYYDESLKIVSDWKWFLQSIVLGGETPVYVDIDVTLFDMTGVSESIENRDILLTERKRVLSELIPQAILRDYQMYSHDVYAMRRIHRYPCAFMVVRFFERCLFKIERYRRKRKKIQVWG